MIFTPLTPQHNSGPSNTPRPLSRGKRGLLSGNDVLMSTTSFRNKPVCSSRFSDYYACYEPQKDFCLLT